MQLATLLSCVLTASWAGVFHKIYTPLNIKSSAYSYESAGLTYWTFAYFTQVIHLSAKDDTLHLQASGIRAFWSPKKEWEWTELIDGQVVPKNCHLILLDNDLDMSEHKSLKSMDRDDFIYSYGHLKANQDLNVKIHAHVTQQAFYVDQVDFKGVKIAGVGLSTVPYEVVIGYIAVVIFVLSMIFFDRK